MKKKLSDTQKIPIIREYDYDDSEKQEMYNRIIRKQNASERTSTSNNNYDKRTRKESNPEPVNHKKSKKIKRKLISVLLIVALIFGSIFVGLYAVFSRVNYESVDSGFSFDFNQMTDSVYNVLLVGTDKENDGHARSDSMMLVSINKSTQKINIISFMRDMWVSIPGNDDSRLNAAFSIGGSGLLMQTIEENFDLHIDNYILVDFEMFKQLIDEIGGVTVEITQKEAKFINSTTHAKVSSGVNTLNGDYALIYCRIRKLDSDFMRTQRQRKVMTAIVNKIKEQSIFDTLSAGYNILPLITTDISPTKMISKGISSISAINYSVEQLRIPADGTYSNKTIKSQAVLVPDFEENTRIIHEFINN